MGGRSDFLSKNLLGNYRVTRNKQFVYMISDGGGGGGGGGILSEKVYIIDDFPCGFWICVIGKILCSLKRITYFTSDSKHASTMHKVQRAQASIKRLHVIRNSLNLY